SRVEVKTGELRHIPMIDFHCPATGDNNELVLAAIDTLEVGPGFLIESGKSYHFLGLELLSENALPQFLGKLLLLSPTIDRAWVAHQLIESACALRVSPRMDGGLGPRVLKRIA